MQRERLKKYAELIVKCGLNVQKGQEVIIRCDLDQPEFVASAWKSAINSARKGSR